MTHAAESGHWYHKDGKPCYEVAAKSGEMRPTTLRDARKLDLVPSVTTIIRLAAAPGLEYWKQQQVLHAALTLPKIEGESEDVYLSRIMRDSKEQGKKAAERGTAIHAALQGFYQGEDLRDHQDHVFATVDAVEKAFGGNAWKAELSFAHPSGFGGKCDLSSDQCVIDFKTKEFDENTKLETWDEQHMQIAAYREGLGLPQAKGAIVYVSVNNPGLVKVLEISRSDLEKGFKMFSALLAYWKAKVGMGENDER